MYQRQVTKQGLSGIVLENNKGSKKAKFSLEDLKDLFTLEEETSSSTHRLLQCLCDNENDPDIVTPLGSSPPNSNSDPTTQRSCQLGKLPDNKLIEERLGMSDLLKWEHIPAPIGPHFLQDPHLAAAEENITFVFRNSFQVPQSAQ